MLLDTNILIDISKNEKKALNFWENLSQKPCVSVVSITEFRAGIRNNKEKSFVESIENNLFVLDINLNIAKLAGKLLNKYGKSHGTDIIDCLIASTVLEYDLELVTKNKKHFPMIKNINSL